jgi:BirA family transcriptional regulator, biotin operon repressor / biotin---[acetyl-CoA-carboxylase] ligase
VTSSRRASVGWVTTGADSPTDDRPRAGVARTEAGGGRRIVRLAEVDSTQAVAFALAGEGAVDGTVVVADFQRDGRGRRGRSWLAPPGTSLLASTIIRSRLPAHALPLYSFVAALAVADALESIAPIEARLRWPNDVLVGGRKIAGILLESRLDPRASRGLPEEPGESIVVIGTGINIRQPSFPDGLRTAATSLRVETGRDIDRERLLAALLDGLDRWRMRLEREGFGSIRARWLERSATIGRRVCFEGAESLAVDLAMDGALVVVGDSGERRVTAGEVTDVAERSGGGVRC